MVRYQCHYHTTFPNHQTPAFAAFLVISHAAVDVAELVAVHAVSSAIGFNVLLAMSLPLSKHHFLSGGVR